MRLQCNEYLMMCWGTSVSLYAGDSSECDELIIIYSKQCWQSLGRVVSWKWVGGSVNFNIFIININLLLLLFKL